MGLHMPLQLIGSRKSLLACLPGVFAPRVRTEVHSRFLRCKLRMLFSEVPRGVFAVAEAGIQAAFDRAFEGTLVGLAMTAGRFGISSHR